MMMDFVPAPSVVSNGKADVAFLVFEPLKQRRDDNSFDGNDNMGAKVIAEVLEREGMTVTFCSPETAHFYPVVLVSLTSTYDVFAFYQAVALLPSWQRGKRTFKVLAGGFGMQNPSSIRNYVDYAAFGRAHEWVHTLVGTLLGGGSIDHPSVMCLPDLHPVVIGQAGIYTGALEGFKESFTGCPLKCKFCHYTWARKYEDNRSEEYKGTYVQESLSGGGTPELTWDSVVAYGKKAGRIRVAIDGTSERLRFLYGKPLTNEDIILGIERIGRFEGTTTLLVYNIGNMPTETQADWDELYATLKQAQPENRVIFVLHTTPFRPSLATPMQWEPVALFPDLSKYRQKVIIERPNLRAVHSFTIESPWSHLMSMVAERATPTPESDKIFHAFAFAPALQKGTVGERLRVAQKNFNLEPYLRAYEPGEQSPGWFLAGYVPQATIQKAALKMRQQAQRTVLEPGWLPPQQSVVKHRLSQKGLLAGIIEDYHLRGGNPKVTAAYQ